MEKTKRFLQKSRLEIRQNPPAFPPPAPEVVPTRCLPALRSFFSALCSSSRNETRTKSAGQIPTQVSSVGTDTCADRQRNTVAIRQGRTLQVHVAAAAFLLSPRPNPPPPLAAPCTSTVGLSARLKNMAAGVFSRLASSLSWSPLFLPESPVSRHYLQIPISSVSLPILVLYYPPFSRTLNIRYPLHHPWRRGLLGLMIWDGSRSGQGTAGKSPATLHLTD
ncbi:hypothetical protein CGRA01v4_13405 [Colletotrichum graminicola]|nr:hypothetical protein CGRA01v4_13405 [Colletotrichum graminicola]